MISTFTCTPPSQLVDDYGRTADVAVVGVIEGAFAADTIIKIAGALNVDPCDLIKGLSWTPPSTKPGELRNS
jgi:hypothetical protein